MEPRVQLQVQVEVIEDLVVLQQFAPTPPLRDPYDRKLDVHVLEPKVCRSAALGYFQLLQHSNSTGRSVAHGIVVLDLDELESGCPAAVTSANKPPRVEQVEEIEIAPRKAPAYQIAEEGGHQRVRPSSKFRSVRSETTNTYPADTADNHCERPNIDKILGGLPEIEIGV